MLLAGTPGNEPGAVDENVPVTTAGAHAAVASPGSVTVATIKSRRHCVDDDAASETVEDEDCRHAYIPDHAVLFGMYARPVPTVTDIDAKPDTAILLPRVALTPPLGTVEPIAKGLADIPASAIRKIDAG
jgi:hypothetical protein